MSKYTDNNERFLFDEFCFSCRYYGTSKCEKKCKDSQTRWSLLECKSFKN